MIKDTGKKQNIAIVGLDGCSYDYLYKLFRTTNLPIMKYIYENSIRRKLFAFPPCTPPSWSSIMSGVNPGKHGIYDFVKIINDNIKLVTSIDLHHPRLFEVLAMNNIKSLVINPIPSYPLIMRSRYLYQLTHLFFAPKTEYSPSSFSKYIRFIKGINGKPPNKDLDAILDWSITVLSSYIEMINEILNNEEFSLFWLTLPFPDIILHKTSSSEIFEKTIDSREIELFQIIDKILRIIISHYDTIILVSDHGFKNYKRVIEVNSLLYKLGLAKPAIDDTSSNRSRMSSLILKMMEAPIFKKQFIREFVKLLSKRIFGKNIKMPLRPVDTHHSIAYMPDIWSYGIYVKDKCKIPIIVDALSSIKGIKKIYLKDELFSGPFIRDSYDIYIYPDFDKGYTLGSKYISTIIEKERNVNSHHPIGIFIIFTKMEKTYNYEMIPDPIPNYLVGGIILSHYDIPLPSSIDGLNILYKIFGIKQTTDAYISRWEIIKKLVSKRTIKKTGMY